MEQQKAEHSVAMLCRVLNVSSSGYSAWRSRPPSARAQEDLQLMERIRAIHAASRGTYGAPRVWAELRLTYGIRCSRKRVARLMRQLGLEGAHRRQSRGITRRDPRRPVFPDRVQRVFAADAPDRLWVADRTQHPTGEGWLYLATVLDAFSRKVVGWAMGERPTAELVIEAFYNRRRRHSALGYLSPEEFERRWRLHREVSATVA
ncbi:MAG: IS3 family transposase [Clostridia bacterium]|nr:IS3 family transposase [Clostridia bacterium]